MKKLIIAISFLITIPAYSQLTGTGDNNPQPVLCNPGGITSPSWASSLNQLTVRCPQVRVGIGTPSPTAGLHLITEESISLKIQTTTWNNADISFQSATGHSDIQLRTPGGSLAGLLRFELDADGPNMTFENRVGTPKDLFKVTKNGVLYTQEVIVKAAPFPDYVFLPDYELMSINELDAYINAEGHLPKMPKASLVEEDGLGVSEILVLHTEKVEELTLYIIELNKTLEAVKLQNEKLQKRVAELELNN